MLEGVTTALLGVLVVTTLVGVADRFLLGLGLPWPEELSRFLLVWTSLLAAVVAAKQRKHFQVTIDVERLGRPGEMLVGGLCLLGLGVILGYGVQLVRVFHGQRAPALGIPMSWVYAAKPASDVRSGTSNSPKPSPPSHSMSSYGLPTMTTSRGRRISAGTGSIRRPGPRVPGCALSAGSGSGASSIRAGSVERSVRRRIQSTTKEKMKKTLAGLWIDHREAVIVLVPENGRETKRIRSDVEKQLK